MITSSTNFPEAAIFHTLGGQPTDVVPIAGGRNSKVYALSCAGRNYVLKHYFFHQKDKRNRQRVEFGSLQFLWEQGLRSIPQPIATDEQAGIALYQRINGRAITASEINIQDIDYATDFLVQLSKLRDQGNVPSWPASDACFSLRRMERIIERRLARLLAQERNGEESAEKDGERSYGGIAGRIDERQRLMRLFLQQKFIPAREEILSWTKSYARQKGINWEEDLPLQHRTLSPSDFGFHNALRQEDGKIIFYDFEYFGWDDPAKMIVDFLLHPAMELSVECKQRYVHNMLRCFSRDALLPDRVHIAYSLLSLVWCLIVLNEFVAEDMKRRVFADQNLRNGLRQEEQLLKAERLLLKIKREYQAFFPHLPTESPLPLDERSRHLRRMIIKVVEKGKRGHIPSAFSIVEVLRILYDEVLRYDSHNPKWDERDRFILSKGHGCIILYVLLAEKGFFPEEELWKFCKIDGLLGGHPEHKVPGVEFSTGSLGHGLPAAVGMALRGKRDAKNYRVFTILGDGESNEGSVWEAAMCAAKHKLDNVVVLVDYNKQVTYGTTHEVQDLEPFADKWRSFGFVVKEVDGHDLQQLRNVFQQLPFELGKPNVILCHTIKGKGIKMMERNFPWHHKSSIDEQEVQVLFRGLEEYGKEAGG